MFTEEDKKRYLSIANTVYGGLSKYNIDPYSDKTHYVVCDLNETYNRRLFENIASAIQYIYENSLTIFVAQAWHSYKLNEDTIDIFVTTDLTTKIGETVYELLKDFANKNSPEFKEQLDNAILNGHITFKQYNNLIKEVQ